VSSVAQQWGVSRQTLHSWLGRYEAGGLEALVDRSHRPGSCPHQMPPLVEAVVLELRRVHRGWGPRRIVAELARRAVTPLPSESGVYRGLTRAGLIEPGARRRRASWKRWERGAPMELWPMDVVGGIGLADGSTAKALTGPDDHSRFCVSAAMRRHGVPQQILTDNGKVFTGRFGHPPTEVLLDRICLGVRHRAPPDRAPVADHHRQDRTVPPQPARGVPDRAAVLLAAHRAGRGRRVGGLLQHRPPAPVPGHGDPRRPLRSAGGPAAAGDHRRPQRR